MSRGDVLREPWRLFALAWKTLAAALIPMRLAQWPALLPRIVSYFRKYRRRTRPTALEKIRQRFAGDMA